MSWSLLGRAVRLAFFLRVPLLTLLLVAAFGPIAEFTRAHSLLGNLFDQQTDAHMVGWNVFTVSFAAFLLAFAAVTTLNLTLYYGTERFGERLEMKQARPGLTFLAGLAAAWILVITVIVKTEGEGTWIMLAEKIAAAVGALLAALLATLIAKAVQLALTNPEVTPHPPPFLVFPAYRWGWLEQKFDDLYCWPRLDSMTPLARLVRSVKSGAGAVAQWPLQVFAGAGQGYLSVVPTPKGPRLVLRSGHVFALTLAIIAFLTYLIMGANKSRILTTPALVPGLAYVLLFFLVACWALAALSFFLDRYRFPLLLSVVLLASLTGSTPESDHFFRIETEKSVPRLTGQISFTADGVPEYLTPAQYIRERLKDVNHKRLIFVATPGGGIQAAAWTAVVLNGLDKKIQPFRDSVAMISSVSGGSLGAMIYAASFNAPKDKPIPVLENSMRSAIDEVAWGWTTPDFWRTVVPLFRPNLAIDRGWALEQKWAVVNGLSPAPPLFGQVPATNDTYISDWAAQRTKMPALVLNSTMVESGQHVVFSTTQFPAMKNDARGIVNFYSLYAQPGKHFDVRINTAARLSASFPYVAPAARPYGLDNLYEGDFHFVDGGYYDNLGIDSLIGWLTAAYPHVTPVDQPPVDILILQIRHFNAAASAGGSRHGWSFQLIAPPSGFLNMWNTAPVHRDKNELDLFVDNFPSQGGPKITRVTIPYCGLDYKSNESEQAFESCIKDSGGARFHFRPTDESYGRGKLKKNGYDCADPPLSWKLSQSQKDCVTETWKDFAVDDPNDAIATIREFLNAK